MRYIKKILICLIFMNIILSPLYGSCVIMWTQQYDSGAGQDDAAYGIVLDNSGNVFIAGFAEIGGDNDYCTIKYDNNGNSIWTQEYDSGGDDHQQGDVITIDNSENIYVTGTKDYGVNPDYCTIKYDNNGVSVWTQIYDYSGTDDGAHGVAADNYGYVYVIGVKDIAGNADYCTIKYSNNGNSIWTQEYDSGNDDSGRGIVVDNIGYVYVTGAEHNGFNYDYCTIKYNNDGNSIWTQKYNSGGIDFANSIAIDNSGFIYVTGGGNNNYITIKYDFNGNSIWTQQYDSGGNDNAYSIAVDNFGYVYVTGGGNNNYCTIKYDSDGNTIWTQEYDGGNNDQAWGIAVDNSGYVYVTGSKHNGTDYDYFSIKYLQPPYPDPTSLSASLTTDTVSLTWQDNTINESGFKIERSYNGVNYFVIGRTLKNTSQFHDTSISQQTTCWYRVSATNAAGKSAFASTMITRAPTYSLDNVVLVPNPYNPKKSPKNYITFFNCPDDVTIKIYDILGDKIKELASPNTEHKIIWDVKDSGGRSLSRGMYMAILKNSQGKKRTIKFLIHR